MADDANKMFLREGDVKIDVLQLHRERNRGVSITVQVSTIATVTATEAEFAEAREMEGEKDDLLGVSTTWLREKLA